MTIYGSNIKTPFASHTALILQNIIIAFPLHLQQANMVHPILPTVTKNLSNLELSKTVDAKDNEYQFYYFKVNVYGTTPRALLAYADAKWSNIYPGVSSASFKLMFVVIAKTCHRGRYSHLLLCLI